MKKKKIIMFLMILLVPVVSMADSSNVSVYINETSTTTTLPPEPPAPQPYTETLEDIGEGVGGMMQGISAPLTVFIVLIALGSGVGFIASSIGEKIGESV